MNSKFIRAFADDIAVIRKKYRIGSKAETLISDAVIKLHHIARIVESEEADVRKASEDFRE